MAVDLTDAALDDLRRLGPRLARLVLEQVAVLADDPHVGDPLGPGSGFRKLVGRGGTWRVVYAATPRDVTVWEVWVDGVRTSGAAYAEALHRMQSADTPEVVEHARLLERLGRITGTVPLSPARLRDPVPDWLADALVDQRGLDRLEVATLDARAAFDRWNLG